VSAIVPRWEWRTFGASLPESALAAFAASEASSPAESDEIYFLATAPEAAGQARDTVKVRFDLLDIKVLREVDADGLERWEPVLKTGFPVSVDVVRQVFMGLGAPLPTLARDDYTLARLMDEVIAPSGTIRAVPVHKRRVRYTIDGCSAELSDVTADDRTTRTIAIEATDAGAVIGAVRRLGLGSYINTGYPRGLATLLADLPARFVVIDAGTNSIKFHVAERDPAGVWRKVADRAEITRLGEGLEGSGRIGEPAIERAVEAISGMLAEARSNGAVALAAVGTEGLRRADNGAEVVRTIAGRTGVTIEIVSGETEARLAYLAAVAALGVGDGSVVVFDTGGGSSQFTFGHGEVADERFSIDVGAVRYTERFGLDGPVSADDLGAAQAAIAADLIRLDGRARPDAVIGMGGAITNLTAVRHGLATYDPDVVQGTILDLAEIDRQIGLYAASDLEARRRIVGLQPRRADVILAGACIVRGVLTALGAAALTVSDRGLRHGVLVERFGP